LFAQSIMAERTIDRIKAELIWEYEYKGRLEGELEQIYDEASEKVKEQVKKILRARSLIARLKEEIKEKRRAVQED
jgi:type II secretory pathway component PulF